MSSTDSASNASHSISYGELQKQLKHIPKLTKENLDIKSWSSELKYWIKYQHVTDPETIFTACIITTSGQVREVIQELEEGNDYVFDDDSEEEEDNNNELPSLDKVIHTLEVFYGLQEDQNVLLRELRALRIKKNEKVKDFNVRYRELYLKLDRKRKRRISVLDYADSLQNNREAWKKVSLKDDISLNKAFAIAEKVDRLIPKYNDSYDHNGTTYNTNKNSKFNKPSFKRNTIPQEPIQQDNGVEEITRGIKKLTISTCFYCSEKGHHQRQCPKLNAILAENRKKFYESQHLNQ